MRVVQDGRVAGAMDRARKGHGRDEQRCDCRGDTRERARGVIPVGWVPAPQTEYIVCRARMDRPQGGLPGRTVRATVVDLHGWCRAGAAGPEGCIERKSGLHTYCTTKIRGIMYNKMAVTQTKRSWGTRGYGGNAATRT